MNKKEDVKSKMEKEERDEIDKKEIREPARKKDILIGGIAFVAFLVALLLIPHHVAGIFTAMAKKAFDLAFGTYILGYIGASIVVAVMLGRILERIGMTDALIKIFSPISRFLKINPTFMVPGIYNFLGDVNAAGKITAPILESAGASKDEKRIAIATMMQFPPAFGSFLLGLTCLATGKVNALLAVVLSVFVPLFLFPLILRFTLYRNCQYREVSKMPGFTPRTSFVDTIFGSVMEGANILFLVIVPTTCAIFAGVALLEYFHIWPSIQNAISAVLRACSVEPTSGINSILVSGAVALPQFNEMMLAGQSFSTGTVLSTFMLGTASVQFVLPFAQIPIIWKKATDLSFWDIMSSAVVGVIMRLLWCALIGHIFL